MSRSSAQKKCQKLVRESKLNPKINRSSFAKLDLWTRKTKTKKDYLYRTKHKKNRYPGNSENDSFFDFFYFKITHNAVII
jgi:hypothetical protein